MDIRQKEKKAEGMKRILKDRFSPSHFLILFERRKSTPDKKWRLYDPEKEIKEEKKEKETVRRR